MKFWKRKMNNYLVHKRSAPEVFNKLGGMLTTIVSAIASSVASTSPVLQAVLYSLSSLDYHIEDQTIIGTTDSEYSFQS
jgi:hypothetical protein